MNLLKKNKDGSAFYYWKSYQMLEGGTLRLYDGDLFPFKTNILGNLDNNVCLTVSAFLLQFSQK